MQLNFDNIQTNNRNPNIPDFMEYLFGDSDFAKLDYQKYLFYIIEKALLIGRPELGVLKNF